MGVWDRGAQVGTGRWHVRLTHPAGIVQFLDITSDGEQHAIAQAQTLFPGYTVEWAILEPDTYGVWSNGMSGYGRVGPGGPA